MISKFNNNYSLIIMEFPIIIVVAIYGFADLCDEINFFYTGDTWDCKCCNKGKVRFRIGLTRVFCFVESITEVIMGNLIISLGRGACIEFSKVFCRPLMSIT